MDSDRIYLFLCVLLSVIYSSEGSIRRGRRRPESCGEGWTEMHRACYKFDKRKLSWEDAKAACIAEGGDLTSISSVAEKKKVTRQLQKQITTEVVTWWVGLKFIPRSRKFVWEDGGNFNRRITNWGPGEPNSGRGRKSEHCVELNYKGFLNDQECDELRYFVCERHEITQRPIVHTTVPAVTSTSTTIATTSATSSTSTPTTASTTVATTPTTVSSTSTPTTASTTVATTPTTVSSTSTPVTASSTSTPTTTTTSSTSTPTATTASSTSTPTATTASSTSTPTATTTTSTTASATPTTTDSTPAPTSKSTLTTTSTTTTSSPAKEDEDVQTISAPQIVFDSTTQKHVATTLTEITAKPSTQSKAETSTKLDTSTKETTPTSSSTTTMKPQTTTQPVTTPTPATTKKFTTARPRNRVTTLSVLTSTTWEENLSPFHGCFQLSESSPPFNDNGMASAALTQQYKEGATLCPAAYASNMMWPDTPSGTFAEISCKTGSGKATWRCGSEPTCWRGEPNLAGCASPRFQKILKKVLETAESPVERSEEEQVEVVAALVEVTATAQVSVEDVMLTSKVIQSLAAQTKTDKPRNKEVVTSIVKNVVKAGSNIVADNKTSTWEEMAPEDKVRSASNLLVAMETTTTAMAAELNAPTVIQSTDENIDLELHVVDVKTLAEGAELVYDDEGADNTISIPLATLKNVSKGGLTKAVFMTHYKMADLLEERPKKTGENRPKPKIASSILSISLGTEDFLELPEPITFTMKHMQVVSKNDKPKCSFWDLRENDGYGHWSQDGCWMAGTNTSFTTCQCKHLTNFAILMDVEGVQMELVHEKLLTFITIVGCIISILCLLACWLTFTCFGALQGERNSIHKNLVVCLFVAEVLFVFGIDKYEHELACRLIAGFLHYFFLCVFMWMLVEGVHMAIMLVQVFDAAKSRLPYYYMVGYGIPLIIVAVSAGYNYQGYGTDKYCWLTTEEHFIWSFAGPVALILLVNAIILTYAMVMVCRHSEYVLNSKEKNQGSMRTWVQGALSMEVLLGLTWTIGYFFINMETIAMAYIFTILNSLQGLFIFSFHCLLNKKVLKEYKRVLHISKRRPGQSTQTASLMRKQSQSQAHEMTTKSSMPLAVPSTVPEC